MRTQETDKKGKTFYYHPSRVAQRKRARERKSASSPPQETTAVKAQEQSQEKVGPVYQCPLSGQSFRGPCAIMPCNFNITQYKPARSCCLYIESNGKKEFDKWDLQDYLGIKESKIYKLKEIGETKSTCVVLLNTILNTLREETSDYEPIKNRPEISNFIQASNLGLKEIGAKHTDIQLIKNNQDRILEFVSQAGHSFNLSDLLGTTQPIP